MPELTYADFINLTSSTDAEPPKASRGAKFIELIKIKYAATPDLVTLNNEFHDFLVSNWKWSPTESGNSKPKGAKLLDNEIHSGECAMVAQAFAILLNSAPPFGFKKEDSIEEAKVVRHAPPGGFITPHNNYLPGPQSQFVHSPQQLINYYLWENHKVVQYGLRFYDPNYRKVYDTLKGMEAAEIETIKENIKIIDINLSLHSKINKPSNSKSTVTFSVYKATACEYHTVLNGYYIDRSEVFLDETNMPTNFARDIYGPFEENPLNAT